MQGDTAECRMPAGCHGLCVEYLTVKQGGARGDDEHGSENGWTPCRQRDQHRQD